MITLTVVLLAIAILILNSKIRATEELLEVVAKAVLADKKKALLENFEKGLQNLFNPKEKKDVKNTRTNRKTK